MEDSSTVARMPDDHPGNPGLTQRKVSSWTSSKCELFVPNHPGLQNNNPSISRISPCCHQRFPRVSYSWVKRSHLSVLSPPKENGEQSDRHYFSGWRWGYRLPSNWTLTQFLIAADWGGKIYSHKPRRNKDTVDPSQKNDEIDNWKIRWDSHVHQQSMQKLWKNCLSRWNAQIPAPIYEKAYWNHWSWILCQLSSTH